MGIEWALCDKTKLEFFNLGKAPWSSDDPEVFDRCDWKSLFTDDVIKNPPPAHVLKLRMNEWSKGFGYFAEEIHAFLVSHHSIYWAHDCGDEFPRVRDEFSEPNDPDWKQVGTRYRKHDGTPDP